MAKKPDPFNNPFKGVKLQKEQPKAAPPKTENRKPKTVPPEPSDDDAALFFQAVGDAQPLPSGKGRAPAPAPPSAASLRIVTDEIEALTRLSELVTGEGPMDLAESDEFVEGAAPGLDHGLVLKLRKGEYAVQAHVDLHGLTRAEAKEALEKFVQKSRLAGHRCVLVITGRGLHSKDQIPVLKEGVQRWLSAGRIARQVLAFTTARPQDGGAGAIYVLLRR